MSTVNNLTARESQTNLQPSELTNEETLGGADNSDRKPITGSDERNVTSFNVGFEESGSEVGGLQTAFKKFKHQKQMEIKQARKLKSHSLIEKSDPEEMGKLRNKFLKQAEDYFGVPYAKRYWKPTGVHSELDSRTSLTDTVAPLPELHITERKKKHSDHVSLIKSAYLTPQMSAYAVCGGNGGPIVDAYLASLGWKKITDKQNFNWKLKWIEVNSQVNYGAFKDGEQLVNRIPNCSLLTNKLGLYNSLSEYNRVLSALKGDKIRTRMEDFVPETYRIDQIKDRDTFLDIYKDGEIWICKPVGLNQGKGIFLIRSREEIDQMLHEREQKKQTRRTKPLMSLIVQRYIEKPLLLENRKFDIRAYMIIPSTLPFIVLYHPGYVRATCEEYNLDSLDLTAHLTNQLVQKKHEDYKEIKEDTVWSMGRFNEYINSNVREEKGLDIDWVTNVLEKQIRSIMKYCFNAVKHKLQARMGFFDIYGLDFMIDSNMRTWLIEVNVNPAMHTNCEALKEVIPPIIEETIDLSLECFEKSKKNQPIFPLQSLKTCHVLYNGCAKSSPQSQTTPSQENTNNSPRKSPATIPPVNHRNRSPTRPQNPVAKRSISPGKEGSWGYINRTTLRATKSGPKDNPTNQSEPEKKSQSTSNSANNNKHSINFIKSNMNIQPKQPVQYAGGKQTLFNKSFQSQGSSSSLPTNINTQISHKHTHVPIPEPPSQEISLPSPQEVTAKICKVEPPTPEEGGAEPITAYQSTPPFHTPLGNTAPLTPSQITARARNETTRSCNVQKNKESPEHHRLYNLTRHLLRSRKNNGANHHRTQGVQIRSKDTALAAIIYHQVRRGFFQAPSRYPSHKPTDYPARVSSNATDNSYSRKSYELPCATLHGPHGIRIGKSQVPS